jgi:hypothetical protein
MTLGIKTLNIKTLSITTLSMKVLTSTTLSKMVVNITTHVTDCCICRIFLKQNVVMLSVGF